MPERVILLKVPKEGEPSPTSPFSFVLYSTIEEAGIRTTAIITSKSGCMPESFREEMFTNTPVSNNSSELKEVFGKLSTRILERYPDTNRSHDQADLFLNEVMISIENLFKN